MQHSGEMPFANYEKYSLGFHKHHSIMHVEIRSPQELCETHFSEVAKETLGSGQGGTDLGALLSELQGLRWVLGYLVDGPQVPVPCCQDKQYSQGTRGKCAAQSQDAMSPTLPHFSPCHFFPKGEEDKRTEAYLSSDCLSVQKFLAEAMCWDQRWHWLGTSELVSTAL